MSPLRTLSPLHPLSFSCSLSLSSPRTARLNYQALSILTVTNPSSLILQPILIRLSWHCFYNSITKSPRTSMLLYRWPILNLHLTWSLASFDTVILCPSGNTLLSASVTPSLPPTSLAIASQSPASSYSNWTLSVQVPWGSFFDSILSVISPYYHLRCPYPFPWP